MLRKKVPSHGTMVTYEDGLRGRVIRGDLLNQTVLIEDEQGQTMTLGVSEIQFQKKSSKPDSRSDSKNNKKKPKKKESQDDWGKDIDLGELMGDPKKK